MHQLKEFDAIICKTEKEKNHIIMLITESQKFNVMAKVITSSFEKEPMLFYSSDKIICSDDPRQFFKNDFKKFNFHSFNDFCLKIKGNYEKPNVETENKYTIINGKKYKRTEVFIEVNENDK